MDPLKGVNLKQPERAWIERLTARVNSSATKVGSPTVDNIASIESDGDFKDSGIGLAVTTNETAAGTKFIILTATNVLKHRTVAQLASDIAAYLNITAAETIEQWAAERFVTDAELPEAGTEPPVILVSPNGTRYALTVDNAGTLGTAVLS